MTPEYASPEQIRGEPITVATDVYQLGVVLKAQDKLEQAEQLQREGLALDRRLLGDRHPQLSLPLLLRSHSQLEADRGPGAPETQAAFQSLHELYTAWNKPDEAARYAPPDSTR